MSLEFGNAQFSGAKYLNVSVLDTKRQIADIQKEQKGSFLHSLTFKLITLGIGCLVSYIKSEIDERRVNQLKNGMKELHRRLDDAVCLKDSLKGKYCKGEFTVQMASESVRFRISEEGRLFARMGDDPEADEYELDASVEDLRFKLAEDIFAHPDIFNRKDLKELLPVRDEGEQNRQQLSVKETYERRVFMLAIESRSNIRGDRLENITTANLRYLAVTALSYDWDADMITEELVGLLDCYEQAISADRLTSIEAETLVQAFEEQADAVKDAIVIAPTMEKDSPPPSKEVVQIPQSYRNFIADFFSEEFNGTQDGLEADEQTVMNVMIRNRDVLAEMIRNPQELNRLYAHYEDGKTKSQSHQIFAEALGGMRKFVTIFTTMFPALLFNVTGNDVETCLRRVFGKVALGEQRDLNFIQMTMRSKMVDAIEDFAQKISAVPDEAMKKVSATFDSRINDIFKSNSAAEDWDQATTIDAMMANAKAASGKSGYLNFVKTVLKNYFQDIQPMDKRSLVAAVVRYGRDGDTEMETFGAMLKGAGPLLQKMLQGLDDSYFTEDFKKIFLDMKKNLAPIDRKQIQAYLLDIKNRSGGKVTSIEAKKSLGAASVGVVLDCTMHGKGKDDVREVAVKMLRPDALVRIGREKGLMLKYAKACNMEKPYEAQLKTVMGEFDFTEEVKNLRLGEIYNKGSRRVRSVRADNVVAATQSTLVMEKAPGRTAADVTADARQKIAALMSKMATNPEEAKLELQNLYADLEKMHNDLCSFAKQWLTEGIFGSGFFHGDLHAGNIMLDPEKGLTVLDFGNATQLTKKQQEDVTRVIASASVGTRAVGHFMNGFRELLTEDGQRVFDNKQEQIQQLVEKVLGTGEKKDAGSRIFIILSKLQEMGVEIPGPIFAFSQSENRLEATIDGMTAVMDNIRTALTMLPSIQMKGTGELGDLYFNSTGKQFAEAVESNWKIQEAESRGDYTKSRNKVSLDLKFENLREGFVNDRVKGVRHGDLLMKLQNSEKEDRKIKKTIRRFREMGIKDAEQLEKDYDAYFVASDHVGKAFKTIDFSSLDLLIEQLRKEGAEDEFKKNLKHNDLTEEEQEFFSAAFADVIAAVEEFKQVDDDVGKKGFLAFLKERLYEATGEAQDSFGDLSVASFKSDLYNYLLNNYRAGGDGSLTVNKVDEKIKSELQLVFTAPADIITLGGKVVDGFMKADLDCLDKLHEDGKGLENILPKKRPSKFLDCVSEVLSQHAVSALKRVGTELVRLSQMA